MKLSQLKYVTAIADTQSINEAAKRLFVAQPSLSGAVKDLEKEIGFEIFVRSNRGVEVTREGREFLRYAKQVTEQVENMERRFAVGEEAGKNILSISEQHYAIAVAAMIEYIRQDIENDYDLIMRECRTSEVIEDVKNMRSELGIVSVNKFNQNVMAKYFKDNRLNFTPMLTSAPYVFLKSKHPLAGAKSLKLDDLSDYPYLCYEQKYTDSLYFSEEILSTTSHKKRIVVNDRATIFNLMLGLDGYSIASGLVCREMNGKEVVAIPLEVDEAITIGYITPKNSEPSAGLCLYLEKLRAEVERAISEDKSLKIELHG